MNFTVSTDIRVTSEKLSDAPIVLTFQPNEYINQANITLSREQAEDLARKIVDALPHSEALGYSLYILSRGKKV